MADSFDLGFWGMDGLGGALARTLAGRSTSVGVVPFQNATLDASVAPGIEIVPSLERLAAGLRKPRTLILRAPVDPSAESAFAEALEMLQAEDLLVDASDSWFRETAARSAAAADQGVHYLALGLSPSELSAAPLLFASGRPDAFTRASAWLEAGAPRGHGERGLGYLGLGPAAHFVRMTHAAIDNAVTEIVREARCLLERGIGAEAGDLLAAKAGDPFCGYLQGSLSNPAAKADSQVARWAVEVGNELEIPMLTLQAASGSGSCENREALAEPFCQPHGILRHDGASLVAEALGAVHVALVIAYTEGLALIATASDRWGLNINLRESVRVWRAGASLRAPLLADILAAIDLTPGLPNLLFDDDFSERVMDMQELLRHAVWQADEWNIPTPALAAALRYIDTFRDAWLPINLVQPAEFHFAPRPHSGTHPIPAPQWHTQRSSFGPI